MNALQRFLLFCGATVTTAYFYGPEDGWMSPIFFSVTLGTMLGLYTYEIFSANTYTKQYVDSEGRYHFLISSSPFDESEDTLERGPGETTETSVAEANETVAEDESESATSESIVESGSEPTTSSEMIPDERTSETEQEVSDDLVDEELDDILVGTVGGSSNTKSLQDIEEPKPKYDGQGSMHPAFWAAETRVDDCLSSQNYNYNDEPLNFMVTSTGGRYARVGDVRERNERYKSNRDVIQPRVEASTMSSF